MRAGTTRVGRRLSDRSRFPLKPVTAASYVEEEPPPPPPTTVGTVVGTETADTSIGLIDAQPPSVQSREGTIAVTETNDGNAISGNVGAATSYAITLRPNLGITGWNLVASPAPTNTSVNTGTVIQHDAGGFTAGSHTSTVSRNLPATDNITAYGRVQATVQMDIGNLNANLTGYTRLITFDNLPATVTSTGQNVGTTTTKWRLAVQMFADAIPRLVSFHEGVTDITFYIAPAQFSAGVHTFDIDFTPSQGLAGEVIFKIDGVVVYSASGIQTVPSGVDPSHVIVTHISAGVEDALSQPVKRLSLRTQFIGINVGTTVVTPGTPPSGTIIKTEANDTPTILGNHVPPGGGGTPTSFVRPSSEGQTGPQTGQSTSLVTNPSPGTHNGIIFTNPIAIGTGTYTFNNCTMYLQTSSFVSGRSVKFNNCRLAGAFEDGGQTGMNGDWCLLIGNDYAFRPKGRLFFGDVNSSTPSVWRSCIFKSQGPPSSGTTHCEAVQTLGCADMQFIACWFYIQGGRFKSDGTTSNTAAFSHWGGNCLFDRCGLGEAGAAFYMAYSSGGAGNPNNYWNNCVVGVCGNPAGERPLVASDFYSGTDPAYKAILNGVRIT